MRCGDSFLATITTYIKAHADDYSSGTYTIVRKLNIPDYNARYMIQLYGDGALHLNAFIAPPAVDGGIVPIFFSIDISQIDGSYDWEYSYYGDMEGTIYSATLKNNTDSLLYLTTDMGYYSEINSAQELSATLAKGLIEFLADVAMAADECLTLDNFGFVNYIYNPTEHVPGENGGGSEAPQITRVTSVSLNKSTLSLKAGEEASLTATVSPSNATNKTILWSSSNNDVATVTNGRVVAVGSGTAVITATSQDGNKTAKCTVTVQSSYEILRDAIEESGGKVSVGVLLGASITLENKSNSIHISLDATQTVLYTSSTTVIFSGNIYEDDTADGYSIYSTIKYSGSVYTGLKTTESKSTTLYFDFSLVDLGKEFDYYVTFDSSSYTQDRLSYNITYSGTHMTTAKSYARDILDDVIDGLTNLRKLATNPSYTITYDANNGQVSSKTQTVKYEGYCVLLTPTRNGYDFDGWYYNGTKVTSGKWTINHDVTLTAKWTPKNYTITYSLNGGRNNSSNPSSYSTGASITLLEPTKTGYTFIGWTTSNVTTPTKNISIKPTDYGDKTFTANWSANTYNVTFDANGGQCSVQTAKYTYGNSVTLPVPYKEDYDFVGWYNGATKVENGTWRVPNNCTLTAKWTLKQYSISYVLDGGKNNLLNPNTYTKEMEVTLLDPTRTGYSFIGWTTDGITSPTKSIKIEKGSSGAKTFTAHWTANTYTAIFDADGGTCDIETKEFVFDEMCSLPTPTRIGYIFTGWYYNNSQIGSVWKIADDCTLIAMWSAKTDTTYIVNHYKENANDNSYTLYETQNLTGASDSFVTPEVNTYEGFTSPERQTVTIAPDGSLIVDYFYIRNCYTLSFVMNGGQEISDIQVKYQESVNMPVGIREDFTFGGWFIDKNLQTSFDVQTMHSDDQTLYAWWCEENKPADFKYSGTTAITVSGYTGNDSTLWIPSYIGNIAVTSISASAFVNHSETTKIVVPDSVTSIGVGAFKGCVAIEDITLPFVGANRDSTSTFSYIFTSVPDGLTKVTITDDLTIPSNAFKELSQIESITIPEGVTSIGSYAFYNCDALKRLNSETDGLYNLPTDLTSISSYVFYNNSQLVEVAMGSSLTSIGSYAFSGCSLLSQFNSDNANEIIVPEGVTSIGRYAFQNVLLVTKVVVPDSVTSIGVGAFMGCNVLEEIALPFVGGSFASTNSNAVFGYIFGYIRDLASGAINQYPDYYYYIPTSIRDVTVTVQTNIPAYAFKNCDFIESITIPEGVTSIESYAFYNCDALKRLNSETDGLYNLPTGLTSISDYTFANNSQLMEVTMGSSLTSTTYYATFGYIFGYSTSSASGTVNQCSNYYYYIPSSIKNVTVTVQTSIPAYAFKNCDFIETIHLPKYVETYGSVGSYAFQNCSATILYDVIPKISMPWKGSVATAYNSGSGTKEDPFVIFTPEQFAYFASQVNGGNSYSGVYFKLASDINLNRYALNVIGGSPETPFAGVFDGNGFTISRINISSSGNYVGLFGYCSGTIKNLGLASGTITANSTSDSSAYVGALVGWLSGTIDNCYSNASVNATLVKDSYVGGLIGANDGLVTNSHCGGNVVANYSYAGYAGGFVGLNQKSIKDSYATGNVTCNSANFMAYAGGFVGTSTATIQDCYAAGNVTAKGSAFSYSKNGGFVGDDVDESLIVNCFRASEQVLTQYTTSGSAFNALGTELPLSEIVKIIG